MAEQQNNLKEINNQISDSKKIEEITGYKPGKVYLYNEDKAKNNEPFENVDSWNDTDYLYTKTQKKARGVYDINSGNFHIIPNNEQKRLTYLNKINDAIDNLKPAINEALQAKLNDSTVRCSCGQGVHGTHLDIEKYISFTYKGYDYMLCFERLYKDGDQINSLLGAFQFYKQPVKFYVCYPESPDNGVKKSVTMVYNPVDLPSVEAVAKGERVENVCKAFLEFIFGKTE